MKIQTLHKLGAWRSTLGLLSALLLAGAAVSCTDDDLVLSDNTATTHSAVSRATPVGTASDGLQLMDDGTWKALRRVPLVGQGRIIDNQMKALVTVGSTAGGSEGRGENVIDLDLTNSALPRGDALNASVGYNSIVSVRDVNYVYSGGQKAGFVVRPQDSGALTADLMASYSVATYLKGEPQEEKLVIVNSGLISLNIGKISVTGDNAAPLALEAEFTKPFDEVRLSNTGVSAGAGTTGIEIYYAYVGESPELKAINDGNSYFNNNCSGKFDGASNNGLVDANLSNGPTFILLGAGTVDIDFGRDIPAGAEIGFVLTFATALDLGVGATTAIKTYSDSDSNTETGDEISYTNIVALGIANGGNLIYNMVTTKPCRSAKIIFGGLPVTLGGFTVNYAYVREPVELDISSYFTMANGITYTPAYQFAQPKDGTVEIISVTGPDPNATFVPGTTVVKNLNIPGNYQVTAKYIRDGKEYIETATVTRKVKTTSNCNIALVNDTDNPDLYEAYMPNSFSLVDLSISNVEGDLGDVTGNVEDCITFKHPLSVQLANNRGIIGVRKKTGNISTGNPMRVGFVVNKDADFLKANVLNFYRVRLLLNGEEKESSVVNGGVNVSLIKDNDNPKTRFYIEIDDTDLEFNQIELYYTGVLNADIIQHDLSIYYAFVDDDYIEKKCFDPGEECMQLMTNASYNAQATFDVQGLASVGTTVTNLGNIIDGNIETYATVAMPLEAAVKTIITTTFDEVNGGQAIGFILNNQIDVAALIDAIIIKAYYDTFDAGGNRVLSGEPVMEASGGGALNVTLGSADYKYIFITPPADKKVNRMELIFGKGLEVGGYQVCGVFTRPDLDGNGTLDCLEDEANTTIREVKLNTPHLCGGEDPEIEISGGEDGKSYTLTISKDAEHSYSFEVKINNESILEPTSASKDAYMAFFADPTHCGVYTVNLTKVDDATDSKSASEELYIYPAYTTWKGTVSANWDAWDNWDYGVPWECTNVIIPSPDHLPTGAVYPTLSSTGDYRCNHIHFEPLGQIKNQNYLKVIGKAFVDMKLSRGTYHLVSAPLKGMITGDMFGGTTSADWQITNLHGGWDFATDKLTDDKKWTKYEPYFNPLSTANYVEKRFDPLIYQRFWNRAVRNETLPRGVNLQNSDIFITDWSRSFNAVGDEYYLGQCFAIRVGANNESGSDLYFHFPKTHPIYYYYTPSNKTEAVKGEGVNHSVDGKLAVGKGEYPINIPLSDVTNSNVCSFGNPFMAYISVQKLKGLGVTNVYRFGSTGYTALGNDDYIAPCEGVLLEVNTGTTSLSITEDMLATKNKAGVISMAISQLSVSAMVNGQTSTCKLNIGANYHNEYKGGEDALLILPSETQVDVAIYTPSPAGALSLQSFESAERIPLGLYLRQGGDVQLNATTSADAWRDWYIQDEQTGEKHALNKLVTLRNVESGSGRFFLTKD